MPRRKNDSECQSSDGSMDHPIAMKRWKPSSKSRLDELPEILCEVTDLRNEFMELYEKDYPQLQKCIEKLCTIVKNFERSFRRATAGTRNGAAVAGTALIAGLALAPFTFGISAVVGTAAATGGGIYGGMSSSKKKNLVTELRNDIKTELKSFQDKINPMSKKIIDINKRIKEILKDLERLELEASDMGEYFGSISSRRTWIEDMTALNAQLNITISIIGTIAAVFSGLNIFLDLLSIVENTEELDEMDKLAKTPLHEQIDENQFKTKAGRFIVEMRKVIHKLEKIMEEIKTTKNKLFKIKPN